MKAAAQNLTFQSFEKDAEREFSLLRAAPFSYDIAANTITTPFPGLIGQLLLTPANTAPILSGEITHLFRQAISDQRRTGLPRSAMGRCALYHHLFSGSF